MSLVCDSLNMCKDREIFINDGGAFAKTPNFCPFCGKKWFVSAISEIAFQPCVDCHCDNPAYSLGPCINCGGEMPIGV